MANGDDDRCCSVVFEESVINIDDKDERSAGEDGMVLDGVVKLNVPAVVSSDNNSEAPVKVVVCGLIENVNRDAEF